MREERSGREPSGRSGAKPRVLQASAEERSKVWPEETMTGSAMREEEIGQRNSEGGFLGRREEAEERWKEIFHLVFPLLPISATSFFLFLLLPQEEEDAKCFSSIFVFTI